MKLLVTGGGGFVMCHVVREFLLANPDATALIMDQSPLDPSAQGFFADLAERIEIMVADAGDAASWGAISGQTQITHMVHGAAVTSIVSRLDSMPEIEDRLGHIENAMATNIMSSVYAMGFALQQHSLEKFINVSSGSIYGLEAPTGPLPENGYVGPSGFYAVSKYSAELLLDSYKEQFGLPGASVRLSGVYGPMDRQTSGRDVRCVPYRIAHGIIENKPLRINSLNVIGDFIHVVDVAKAINGLSIADTLNHDVYNIAYGKPVSIGQMIRIAQRRFPELTYEIVAADEAEIFLDPLLDKGRYGPYSIKRIFTDTGWQPRSIEDGISDYLAWLEGHNF